MLKTVCLALATGASAYSVGSIPAASARHAPAMMAADSSPLTVGVLAIQGGFEEHVLALKRQSGVEAVEVRTPYELLGCDALILPGGESTAIGHGLVAANMLDDVKEFCASKPVWGICAGLILLANELDQGAQQPLIGGLDINVKRNAFGRQSKSAFRPMTLAGGAAAAGAGESAYFIRAPVVSRTGDGVEVLAPGSDAWAAATAVPPAVIPPRQPRISPQLPRHCACPADGLQAVCS